MVLLSCINVYIDCCGNHKFITIKCLVSDSMAYSRPTGPDVDLASPNFNHLGGCSVSSWTGNFINQFFLNYCIAKKELYT